MYIEYGLAKSNHVLKIIAIARNRMAPCIRRSGESNFWIYNFLVFVIY